MRRAARVAVVDGLDVADLQDGVAEPGRGSLHGLDDLAPDHRATGADPAAGIPAGRDLAPAHDRDPVGDREHFAELVADERDAPAPAVIERSVRNSSSISGARTAVGSSMMRIRAVEQLQDLDALLLTDRQLPDPRGSTRRPNCLASWPTFRPGRSAAGTAASPARGSRSR